jgi:hypothetical protein
MSPAKHAEEAPLPDERLEMTDAANATMKQRIEGLVGLGIGAKTVMGGSPVSRATEPNELSDDGQKADNKVSRRAIANTQKVVGDVLANLSDDLS